MSIETESPSAPPQPKAAPPISAGFGLPEKPGTPDVQKLTDAIAQLETTLLSEREAWREKEFIFIAAIAFLGSVICFKLLDNTLLSIMLFLFELIILTGLANRMGVDWAVRGIGWLTHIISERFSKNSKSDGGGTPES